MPVDSITMWSNFLARRERRHRFNEVLPQRATNAAIGELDHTVTSALKMPLTRDERCVNIHFRKVVDDHRDFAASAVGQQVVEERGFPRTEEPRQNRHRCRPKVGHVGVSDVFFHHIVHMALFKHCASP